MPEVMRTIRPPAQAGGEPTQTTRRGFMGSLGAALLVAGCGDSIFPCRDSFPNGGCVVSKGSGMKAGDSLKAGNLEFVFAGLSADVGGAAFDIKNVSGNIAGTVVAKWKEATAVKVDKDCTGFTITVTSMDTNKALIDAEVRKYC
jgi:hypothetical protein